MSEDDKATEPTGEEIIEWLISIGAKPASPETVEMIREARQWGIDNPEKVAIIKRLSGR